MLRPANGYNRAGRILKMRCAFLSGGAIATSLLNRAPHPNAARVYVNWYLSKDGSTVQSRVVGVHSARSDVPTDHLRPEDIRDPSVKYVETEAEWYFTQNATNQEVAAKIFAPLLK
ncbi:MAG: hypothetical protein HY673_00220 [Chloroflexi bacterium]|nr:hypothetical protein [Chloroflexota bacterium]